MKASRRALLGALAGVGGTVALSMLRQVSTHADLVSETAPEQVVERARELGLLEGVGKGGETLLTLAAHYGYGAVSGAVFGLLRRESGTLYEEMSTGTALGVLAWGAGWAVWLPLTGVHSSPWSQKNPRVLLPIVDHAAFGAAWGFVYRSLLGRDG
ncbi:Hypothetical Protein RradSPS_0940 [Rubrobacter radiotolerans]|uniref:DUF1440 domain-containing protein n=1 Tax=Rubrobacter radiotolerans TaxID=42256 RepID=A0A023X1K8_RUBRA|nr:hypothetical protein [Rubrobacter radiotolerans]AHY46223.1 Hypothetical Protein RradSPS_0940 [Rubrobacter radiotolerans]MDX5893631.1 hypothetical protein [Rubrobacter radiotolerans]SMC04157.1 conserved hypothetical protein [Rubrobacter radiotolerans DSM 5868]